jgi:hypothetical protein
MDVSGNKAGAFVELTPRRRTDVRYHTAPKSLPESATIAIRATGLQKNLSSI